MTSVTPTLARWVAWSALSFCLILGGTACGERAENPGHTDTPELPAAPSEPTRARPDAERSSVEVVSARSARANGQDTVELRVTVRSADGAGLEGQSVTVEASGEGNAPRQASSLTNAEGVMLARLASSVSGEKSVTASVALEGGTVTLSARPTVEFIAGAAPRLVFSSAPREGTAGEALEAFDVTLQDDWGQPVVTARDTVTVALGAGSPEASLQGTLTVAAVNGVARFSSVRLDKASAGYRLVASSAGRTPATSASFDVRPAAASAFALEPSGDEPAAAPSRRALTELTAGTPVRLALTARDAFGNTASGYTGTVRVTSDDPTALLPGTLTFTEAERGRASFSVTLLQARTGREVRVTDTARAALTSALTFSVKPAAAAKLVFLASSSSRIGNQAFEARVGLLDAFGNPSAGSAPRVTLSLDRGTLVGPTSVTPVDGVASFPGLSIAEAGVGYVLTASAPGLESARGNAFDVTAPVDQLVLTADVSVVTAGNPVNFTLTAIDAAGNRVPGYTGTVHFSSSEPSDMLPRAHTFTAAEEGRYTFVLKPTRSAIRHREILATDQALKGQVVLTVTPAPPVALEFKQQPVDTAAGKAYGVQVMLVDAYGNLCFLSQDYTVIITLNKSGIQGASYANTVYGVASFGPLSIGQEGSGYMYTATSAGMKSAWSQEFSIRDGGTISLGMSVLNSDQLIAGVPTTVIVSARDQFNAVREDYTGTVRFTSTDPAALLPAEYTFTAADHGQKTFPVTFRTADRPFGQNLDVWDDRLHSSHGIYVKAGPPATLRFHNQPVSTWVNEPLANVQVALFDAYDNPSSASAPDIELGLLGGDPAATLSGTLKASPVQGIATFPGLRVDRVGVDYQLAAFSTPLEGAHSLTFTIAEPSTASVPLAR